MQIHAARCRLKTDESKEERTMDAKKIGAFIAESRRARGLTQQQLAGELGVTNRAVSKWETEVSLR